MVIRPTACGGCSIPLPAGAQWGHCCGSPEGCMILQTRSVPSVGLPASYVQTPPHALRTGRAHARSAAPLLGPHATEAGSPFGR